MKTFKQFIVESFYPIQESPFKKKSRLNAGLTKIVTIDAAKFKTIYEKEHNESLNWNKGRLENLRDLRSKNVSLDMYPEVGIDYMGRIAVNDGRHRISHAAELGMKIQVAVQPSDATKLETKLNERGFVNEQYAMRKSDFKDIGDKLNDKLRVHNYQVAPLSLAGKIGKNVKSQREYRLQLINKSVDTSNILIKHLESIIKDTFSTAKNIEYNSVSRNSSKFPSYSFVLNDHEFDLVIGRGANKGENFETKVVGDLAKAFNSKKDSPEFAKLIEQLKAANPEFATREIKSVTQRKGTTRKEGVPIENLGAIIGDIVLEDTTGHKWFISLKDANGSTFSSYSGAASLFNSKGDIQSNSSGANFLNAFGTDLNTVQHGFDVRNKISTPRTHIDTLAPNTNEIEKIFKRAWGMNYFYVRKLTSGWKVFWLDEAYLDKLTSNITIKEIRYPSLKSKQISILCGNTHAKYMIELRNSKAGEYPNDTKFKVL